MFDVHTPSLNDMSGFEIVDGLTGKLLAYLPTSQAKGDPSLLLGWRGEQPIIGVSLPQESSGLFVFAWDWRAGELDPIGQWATGRPGGPARSPATSDSDDQLPADAAGLEAAVGVGGALERVGVGDRRSYAGCDLGRQLVEPIATGSHQDAVEVDVAVDGQVEVATEVDDGGGPPADADVRQRRLELTADQVDDRVELVTQLLDGSSGRRGVGPVEPQVDAELLDAATVVDA
jgi:hypothetical protein